VNIALILKFMANFFFNPAEYPVVPRRDDPANDEFLFRQGPTRGLGTVQFHSYKAAYASWDVPNVRLFCQQIDTLREMLGVARPDDAQQRDTDFLLALGELFTLVVYGQLILENARIYGVDGDTMDQVFDFMVRDFSRFAVQLHGKPSTTLAQASSCLKMIQKPATNMARLQRVWERYVFPLKDEYEMNA
jgi:acyl-CoA dehydrogenase